MHSGYTHVDIVFEDENVLVWLLRFKVPVFSFVSIKEIQIVVKRPPNSFVAYNLGLFGIPIYTKVELRREGDKSTTFCTKYRFELSGWRKILAPFLYHLCSRWNQRVWDEDLPVITRRQEMLDRGFKDFVGITANKNLEEPMRTMNASATILFGRDASVQKTMDSL